jgi:Putative beta-barrel porin-2, OmpL-like. bbp2
MHGFVAFVLSNMERIVLVTVCLLGVGFLVWFLVALLLDERRMRERRRSGSPKAPTSASPIRVEQTLLRPRDPDENKGHKEKSDTNGRSALKSCALRSSRAASSPGRQMASRLYVFRLSDRNFEKNKTKLRWLLMVLTLCVTFRLSAQTTDSTSQKDQTVPPTQTSDQQNADSQHGAPPTPVTTPAITGPLQAAPPIVFDAGPLGKLDLDGIVSGIGLWQGNHASGDDVGQAGLSNGQVFIQKTTDWWQFYVQAGAYNILALGTPFLPTDKALTDLYGPVPVAFMKLVPGKNTSILVGALPTLMGAEYTFDFENMNIERGLLWNQENAVNRGIQVNQTMGKFTASISWNDGYYSNRYSWLSGSLTYTKGPHALSFIGMGNLGQTARQTLATPVQNNGSIYDLLYTYTKGSWIVQPYFQYGRVPTNPAVGVVHGASTTGGALLVNHTLKHGFSLAGRGEYIASSGSAAQNSINLMYGPGSSAWSLTLTPTLQYQRFFTRGDLSIVRANNITAGNGFGATGTNTNQPRGVIEVGFLF